MRFCFFSRRRRTIIEILESLVSASFQTVREVKHVATQVQNAIERLKAVEAKQDKTLGEISEAKRIQAEQTAEIARLRDIIANLPETVPPETIAALEEVVSSIESKQTAIDEALPDLPEPGVSPDEGAGGEVGEGSGEPAPGDDSVETGAAPSPTPFK